VSTAIPAYFDALQDKLAELARDEAPALARAADVCAEALASRNVLHLYDTGHLISHEMVGRTGGLVAYTALSFRGVLDNHNLWRAGQPSERSREGELAAERALLDWVFAQGTLRRGDVLIIGSVSGTGMRLIELAERARAHGLAVIAVTALAHSSHLASEHPSGKRLFDVADVVLDNHADYGDSFFSVDGLERAICPFSGVAAASLLWALTAGIVERLVVRGLEPSIYTSIHLPGGPAAVEQVEAAYRRKGY
jgi:uncharacterized phosphosugar-binding protein